MDYTKKDCLNCGANIDVLTELDENDEVVYIQGAWDVCGVCVGQAMVKPTFERTEFGCPDCNTALIKGFEGYLFCSQCKYKETK